MLVAVASVVQRAFVIAPQHRQRAYDCLYVALAEREGMKLCTGGLPPLQRAVSPLRVCPVDWRLSA